MISKTGHYNSKKHIGALEEAPRLPSTGQIQNELKRVKYSTRYREVLRSTIYFLIIIAAVAVLIATLVMPVVQITGTSMEPTLMDGDIVVLKKTGRFECGNLCAFYYQNRVLLKRVVGNPGDYIEIDSLGNVKVNGEMLVEPYISEKSLGECDLEFPYQVPEDKFFVLGDHRRTSVDSRSSTIGCIETEQIIGRVLFRVWPLNKMALLNDSI